MVDGSTRGLFSYRGIVGSSYVIVSVGMCAITFVSGKSLMYGVWFWYHLLAGMVSLMVLGLFFAASLAQYMAISTFFSL